MSMLPRMYKASTRAKAEQALANGALYYPAFCYITSENIMAWVDADNHINYITSDQQITNVTYSNGYLDFMSGSTIVERVFIAMGTDEADEVVKKITEQLNLNEYAKLADVASMLDSRIGDLDGADSVTDYLSALSYNRLTNAPITNVSGSLTKAVIFSTLDEGAYKVTGQYVVGGENETVYSAVDPTFALVTHDDGDTKVTVITPSSIRMFYLTSSGVCSSDKYVTDSYLSANYTSTADILGLIVSTVQDVAPSIVEQIMNEKFDTMLSERVEAIPLTNITGLFGL